jgi:hypothetical protein
MDPDRPVLGEPALAPAPAPPVAGWRGRQWRRHESALNASTSSMFGAMALDCFDASALQAIARISGAIPALLNHRGDECI